MKPVARTVAIVIALPGGYKTKRFVSSRLDRTRYELVLCGLRAGSRGPQCSDPDGPNAVHAAVL